MKPAICLILLLQMTGGLGRLHAETDVRLLNAVKHVDPVAVRALLKEGVDVNAGEADGTSPIHWAVHRDDVETARLLIAAGALVTAANRYGVQPLSLACVNGNPAMIDILLTAGADPNTRFAGGETALMTAARTGIVGPVEKLLVHGANANAMETWRSQTALMWASAEGHSEVVSLLLSHGANVSSVSQRGFTALLFSSREGQIPVVRQLLDAGASLDESLSVNSRRSAGGVEVARASEDGLNAFLLAVANAHYELAALLLERGADPNAVPRGWTALHQMSWVRKAGIAGSNNPAPKGSGEMSSLEFVELMVAKGADLNAQVTLRPPAGITALNMIGGTPFLLAARTADTDLMRLLAELGADPLLPNEDNTTPLMVAAGVGTSSPGEDPGTESEVLSAVQLAIELGGDLNGVDDNGETVMHGAAYKHVPSVVQFLADQGAESDIWHQENQKGWTPLKITEGVKRGMNIISSRPTEVAVRDVMSRVGLLPVGQLQ